MSSEESRAEFPARVALPIGDDGIRRDLEGRWSVWHNANGWWVTDGVLNCHLGTALDQIPTVLKRLGIIDVREKVKAGAWVDAAMCSNRQVDTSARIHAFPNGAWLVEANAKTVGVLPKAPKLVAKGSAASIDEAKAAADHYAAMLYDLEGVSEWCPMTTAQQQVARRLVAAGFPWREGMRDHHGRLCTWAGWIVNGEVEECEIEDVLFAIPDLTDAATIGVIEAAAREAWAPLGGTVIELDQSTDGWAIWPRGVEDVLNRRTCGEGRTCRGTAWAEAWLAAQGVRP